MALSLDRPGDTPPLEFAANPSMEGFSIWLVPHTHWDREWYLPFEQFRIHLARLMDDLLDALEQNPTLVFTLDGQTIMLEDYVEVRPAQEPRLRRLIAEGRIAIGPSYILPDEFLAGQESLIRNLLIGRQMCHHFGGSPMGVGYAPDTFGHISQLPQILNGFGIDSFVFWRGLGEEADRLGAIFWWQAPEGSRVLAIRLLEGYANGRDLGRWTRKDGWVLDDPKVWPAKAANRVAEFMERWKPTLQRAGLQHVLLGNGVDHQPIQRDLPEMVGACQLCYPKSRFHIGTYQDYVESIREKHGTLESYSGELVGGREACVVRGVNSTRMYLKQANEATERAVLAAETLAALAYLKSVTNRFHSDELVHRYRDCESCHPEYHRALGALCEAQKLQVSEQILRMTAVRHVFIASGGPSGPWSAQHGSSYHLPCRGALVRGEMDSYSYPKNELRLAWLELLRNQPHDSLPGCSLDSVHIDMQQRYRNAEQIAQQIQRDALAFMAGRMATLRPWEDVAEARSLVNTLPWARSSAVEIPLPANLQTVRNLIAETADGALPVQLIGPREQRQAVVLAQTPGFGAKQLRFRPGKACLPSHPAVVTGHRAIENEFYRVEVAPNGTLSVVDRITGYRWVGVHWFEDEGDRGDEYSFCPVEGDSPWDSRDLNARVRVKSKGPLVAELEIVLSPRFPEKLAASRESRSKATVSVPLRSVVRLIAGVNRIEFFTTVMNRARDHRLRVFLPAPESGLFVQAEGHFAVLRRPAQPVWNGKWREPPAKTHHTLGGVSAGRLALFGRGLPEYEAVPNAVGGVDLALTLLRCVGWLSCPDLSTRPGAEEPHIPTPDAQCIGSHDFNYAVALRESWSEAELLRASQDFRVGLIVGPEDVDPGHLLSIDGEGFALSTLKGAEDGRGVILRLYNPGSFPAIARIWGPGVDIRRCRLDETDTAMEEIDTVAFRPGEIATLRITPKSGS